MSTRALRLLVSVALVFGVFLYFASLQLNSMLPIKSKDEGKLGGPLPGMTRWQLSKFEEGKELFSRKYGVADGLGPLYNASSCIECHSEAEQSAMPSTAANTKSGSADQPASSVLNTLDSMPAKAKPELVKPKPDSKSAEAKPELAKPKPDNKPAPAKKSERPLTAEASWPELASRTVVLVGKDSLASPASANASAPSAAAQTPKEQLKAAIDWMINEGGPIMVRKSITDLPDTALPAGCKMQAVTSLPAATKYVSKRIPHQLCGLGLIESLPDAGLNFQAARQAAIKNGPHGRAVHLPRALPRSPVFGRFGNKDQYGLLLSFIANEMGIQLGLSNPMFRHTYSGTGLDKEPDCLKKVARSEPNDNGSDLLKINFYLTTLAPPPPAMSEMSVTEKQAAARGSVAFAKTGCMSCHITELQSPGKVMVLNPDGDPQDLLAINEIPPVNPLAQTSFGVNIEPKYIEVRALEKKMFKPFSDFLVHDMGPDLADGIAQSGASGAEWRTAPLWGLRFRKFYLHDGRARKLEDAITAHGGEGESSAKEYKALTDAEKKDLMQFLNSL